MLYTYPSNNYSANYKKVSKAHENATKVAAIVMAVLVLGGAVAIIGRAVAPHIFSF